MFSDNSFNSLELGKGIVNEDFNDRSFGQRVFLRKLGERNRLGKEKQIRKERFQGRDFNFEKVGK